MTFVIGLLGGFFGGLVGLRGGGGGGQLSRRDCGELSSRALP